MGFLFKSITILLIAVSTPLLYRQFANDNTIKFMSSYYSNYKSIDQFLKQSAGQLDRAKDYLPDSNQVKGAVGQLHEHINTLIAKTKTSIDSAINKPTTKTAAEKEKQQPAAAASSGQQKKKEVEVDEKTKVKSDSDADADKQKKKKDQTKQEEKIRFVQCPDEELEGNVRLWSKDELARYDGNNQNEPNVYLAFLGIVYNVTINQQHYAAGSEYNVFAGRDATRAFLSGNFTHDLNDDIRDLDESVYSHLESWSAFYNSNYPVLGRLEGSFFDSRGCGTDELDRVYDVFGKLEAAKEESQQQEINFPDCNSEWNGDIKEGKVWCSEKSGGIEREWVGVPRIYNGGESNRCVCFNKDGQDAAEHEKLMTLYPNCDPKASECILKQ